jgi:plastocyanin
MLRHRSLAIMVVAVLAGCAGTAPPKASPTFGPAAMTIKAGTAGDDSSTALLRFSPATVDINAGDTLQVVDAGDTLHDFTIDVGGAIPRNPAQQHIAVRISVDLVNKTNQAAINLPPGTYRFYCSIDLGSGAGHANNGMVGTITVH